MWWAKLENFLAILWSSWHNCLANFVAQLAHCLANWHSPKSCAILRKKVQSVAARCCTLWLGVSDWCVLRDPGRPLAQSAFAELRKRLSKACCARTLGKVKPCRKASGCKIPIRPGSAVFPVSCRVLRLDDPPWFQGIALNGFPMENA